MSHQGKLLHPLVPPPHAKLLNEEANTRIVIHVVHALEQGAKTILVRTVDTDVVVFLAGTFYNLIVTQPLIDIWVAFGMGKHYRFYHINAICASLGSYNHEHYLCFTHFMDAIQHLPLEVRARSLFDKTSHLSTVNETRRDLFCQKNRAMDKIPPNHHLGSA